MVGLVVRARNGSWRIRDNRPCDVGDCGVVMDTL
jgi:hypothetical protein